MVTLHHKRTETTIVLRGVGLFKIHRYYELSLIRKDAGMALFMKIIIS